MNHVKEKYELDPDCSARPPQEDGLSIYSYFNYSMNDSIIIKPIDLIMMPPVKKFFSLSGFPVISQQKTCLNS